MERIRLIAKGDIFDVADNFVKLGNQVVIVVPTNKTLDKSNNLVMGAGLALAAKTRESMLPWVWGQSITAGHGYYDYLRSNKDKLSYIAAPTKDHWRNSSTWELIAEAWSYIVRYSEEFPNDLILIPLLGSGLGGLPVEEIKDYIYSRLSNNMVMVIPNDS